MSYFAKVLNNVVIDVIKAESEFFSTFIDSSPGTWIQTSYNSRGGIHYGQDGQPDNGIALRANYAGKGDTYDADNDVFYSSRPLDCNGIVCSSWKISAPTWLWSAPVPMPTTTLLSNQYYVWDESIKNWVEKNV